MSNINFAPGEGNVTSQKFSPSVILFWLKTEIAVSSMRVVSRSPNTLFGLIPLGYKDAAFPLASTASVGVEVKFSVGRALFGLIFFLVGINLLDNVFGWLLLILGLSMLLNALSAALTITNHGGGQSRLRVSILEKSKLESFRDEINARVFADQGRLRHEENMDMQAKSLLNQQAQLNLQQQLNQNLRRGEGTPTA